jgi:alkylhydroperoxidase family enzyme
LARRLGATEDEVARMHSGEFDAFPEGEQAAFRFADRMASDSNHVSDEEYAALRRHWDEGEIVEIAAVIGLFSYFNRFNNALRVEVTR